MVMGNVGPTKNIRHVQFLGKKTHRFVVWSATLDSRGVFFRPQHPEKI